MELLADRDPEEARACGRFSRWHRGQCISNVSRFRLAAGHDHASPDPWAAAGTRRAGRSGGHGCPALPRPGLGRQTADSGVSPDGLNPVTKRLSPSASYPCPASGAGATVTRNRSYRASGASDSGTLVYAFPRSPGPELAAPEFGARSLTGFSADRSATGGSALLGVCELPYVRPRVRHEALTVRHPYLREGPRVHDVGLADNAVQMEEVRGHSIDLIRR